MWTANPALDEPSPTRVATVGRTPSWAMAAPKASPPTIPAGAPAATAGRPSDRPPGGDTPEGSGEPGGAPVRVHSTAWGRVPLGGGQGDVSGEQQLTVQSTRTRSRFWGPGSFHR